MPQAAQKTETTVITDAPASIRSFGFKKANFKTEDAVKKWLSDGDWEGFVITDKGDQWLVEGDSVSDEMFSDIRVVKMEDGVVANAGTLKDILDAGEENDKNITTQPGSLGGGTEKKAVANNIRPLPAAIRVKKSTDFVSDLVKSQKWDWWESYSSGEFDLNGIVKAAMEDGVPPGMCQIMDAATTAIGNVLKTDVLDTGSKQTALNTIGTQMGQIIYKMYQVFEALSDDTVQAKASEATKKWVAETKQFVDTQKMNTYGDNEGRVAPRNPASGEGDSPGNDAGTVVGDTNKDKIETPVPHDKGVDATTAGGETGMDGTGMNDVDAANDAAKKVAGLIGPIITAALAPIAESVTKLGERVDSLSEQVEVTKTATESFARRAPTRKAAATVGGEEMVPNSEIATKAAVEAEAAQKFESRLRRNAFGI